MTAQPLVCGRARVVVSAPEAHAPVVAAKPRRPRNQLTRTWVAGALSRVHLTAPEGVPCPPAALEDAVTEALQTECAIPTRVAHQPAASGAATHGDVERLLTPGEIEVMRSLAAGRSDRVIDETLGISPRTAMRHVANVYSKLDIDSRSDATAFAIRQGLVWS